MADIILHRRSFTTGSVPTTESLGVGQFAINVPDGKVFIHKSSSVSQSIVSVVTTDSITTGSITLTGTASAGLFIGQFSGSFSGNSSNAETASVLDGKQTFIDFSTSSINYTSSAGRLTWNPSDGTLDLGLAYGSGSNSIHQIGQETYFTVRNDTGNTIPAGTSVYASGVTVGNGRIEISPFTADGSVREVRYLGLVDHDIATGVNGMVTNFGYVRQLDTRGTSVSSISVGDETWAVGDILYAHPTVAGKLTNEKPKHEISVAIIINRHATSGSLFVRPMSYGHLDDIHDVNINTSSLASGDLLIYDSGSDYWQNSKQLTGSYGISGSLSISGSQSISGSLTVSNSVKVLGDQIITGSLIVSNSVTTIGTQTLTGSFNLTGSLVASSSTIHMHQSASVSGTNIFGTASHAATALTASYVQFQYNRELHVSVAGSDSTGDGTLLFPFRTISKALDSASSAVQIVVHPGTYAENPTVSGSASNVTITATNAEIGGIVEISGSLTVNQFSAATKVVGLAINNIIHSGSQNLYLQNVTVRSGVSKTGNGYLEATKIGCQSPANFSVTAPGTVVIQNSLVDGLVVNNASAVVNLLSNIAVTAPSCSLGILSIDGGVVYSQHVNSGSVFSGVGAIVSLANILCLTPTNTSASIKLNAASGISIKNVTYDTASSTLGVSLGNRSQFQQIQADGITGSFTGSFAGTVTSAQTASFANSGFTINSSSLYSFGRTSSFLGVNSFSVPTGSSRGSILNYTVASASNARAGQVMSIWSGTTASYSETQTTDIGNTSGVSFTSSISGVNSLYTFGTSTAGWNIKFTVTQI